MNGFDKREIALKTQTVIEKFDTFEFASCSKKNGALPIELATNCDISDGKARVGVGALEYTLPSGKNVLYDWNLSTPKAFFYCGDKLGLLSGKNQIYLYEEVTRSYRLAYTFYGDMKVVQVQDASGKYHVCFCGGGGVFSYGLNVGAMEMSEIACQPVACAFQGRIFTAADDSIVYSAPFNPDYILESMDGGGRVVLPFETGKVVDIVATSEFVFVFCEYGIWKLVVSGSARDFRLERVGFTGNGIVKGSACAVAFSGGEKVFFFDQYGPWKLDRLGVVRICSDLTFSLKKTGQVCEHACLNGKVVYNYRDVDGSVKNVVIDAETDKAYHSFTAEGLSDIKGQAVGVVDGFVQALRTGELLPANRLSELVTPECDFNLSGVKTLRRLKVFGEGAITLSVSSGRKTKTFDLQTENGVASVDVRLKGEFFRLRFVLGAHAVLCGLEVELCKLAGVR